MSLINITNIKRDFVLGNEIINVLKGIDLNINKGEYVALMEWHQVLENQH